MALPPTNEPAYQRYWRYTNRPYRGCGCLWLLLLGLLISGVVSLLLPNGSVICLPFVF